MSSVSRIEKMVCEAGEASSLAIAAERLARPLEIRAGKAAERSAALVVPAVVALALRCFRGPIHVVIDAVCDRTAASRSSSVRSLVEREAATYGAVGRVHFTPAVPTMDLMTIGVGDASASVNVNAAGWLCLVNATAPSLAAAAPAAALAAAVGVAKLFAAHVLGRRSELDEAVRFDLWSLIGAREPSAAPDAPEQIGTRRIHLLGAGAIGNAFGWILRAAGWRGLLHVFDHDRYDSPNEETSVLIGPNDLRLRPHKAPFLAGRINGEGIVATGTVARIDAQSVELTATCDVFVCAVDNVETRRMLNGANADVILNAAVGDGRDTAGVVLCTRHGREDWALSDAYRHDAVTSGPARVPTEFAKDDCSRVAYEGVSLAAPFAAMAAGALLTARVAHHAAGHRPATSELELDLFRLVGQYGSRHWRRAA